MDRGGSDLSPSLSEPEKPCLIVEDSQPDSGAPDDDPDSSYRTLLALSLSSLQPSPHSPVLEVISSPAGSRCSQTDQSEQPGAGGEASSPGEQEESQVLSLCPAPRRNQHPASRSSDNMVMEPGAASSTHCSNSEGGTTQLGLELSESQALGGGRTGEDVTDRQHSQSRLELSESQALGGGRTGEDVTDRQHSQSRLLELSESQALAGGRTGEDVTDRQHSQAADVKASTGTAAIKEENTKRGSQASKGSLSLQALLHSQQDSELLSSQEDLFDHNLTGSVPTATPAQTLRLLQLSGPGGTLVEQSLSQSSVDYVAPTQDPLSQTPLIVPNSPTGTQHLHGASQPMDSSLAPVVQTEVKEKEPMTKGGVFKPRPSASTPISQNSPGFVVERPLSVPSQPELSHDVFVPTQSQDGPHAPLSSSSGPPSGPPAPEDSQDTQIEGLQAPLGLDTSDPVISGQKSQSRPASSQPSVPAAGPPPNPASSQPSVPAARPPPNPASSQPSVPAARPPPNPASSQPSVPAARPPPNPASSQPSVPAARPPPNPASSQPSVPAVDSPPGSTGSEGGGSQQNRTARPKQVQGVSLRPGATEPCSQPRSDTPAHSAPCSQTSPSPSGASPSRVSPSRVGSARGGPASSGKQGLGAASQSDLMEGVEEEGEESTAGPESCLLDLELSQSQALSPGGAPEEEDVMVLEETPRSSPLTERGAWSQSKRNSSQAVDGKVPVSTNGHGSQSQKAPDRLSQSAGGGPEAEGVKDKSVSDGSGEIPFHFTLPKGSQLIGPAISTTPPLVSQLKQTPRHSTPIEIGSFSEKSAVGDVSMATSDITVGDSGEDTMERPDGKLSLRMKLVTPVEEGSSERFSLQKPALSDEEGSVVKVTTVTKAVTSPSVFSRVRQAHRQTSPVTPSRGHLFSSPQSSIGCNSLPNSQSELCSSQGPNQEVLASPLENQGELPAADPETGSAAGERAEPGGPVPPRPTTQQTTHQTSLHRTTCTPPNQRTVSQQTSFEAPLPPGGRGEPETPPRRGAPGPAHRRHVRTIQEVRTTVTRVITDVFYEDGREVERKVTQESEDPVVELLDSDVSPCRTGSSLTPGDLGDVSSMSSKASSSSTGLVRPDFIMPPSRGTKPGSPRRGAGQRGQRAGSHVVKDRGGGATRARGGARRGRPPSHSSPGRGGGPAPQASSEEDRPPRLPPQRLPESPSQTSHSDSLRSSPEALGSAASSFVGLRVVAKWSSNGYFYSGRITRDQGEGRFRLRFDDGYECEVSGKDILLCDPIPVETEVTALLDDQFFSIGRVKGHKMEKQDVFYSVEREGQLQWFRRSAVILSLEQGNQLREQFSLGPYEPASPLAKAADISLDNLVEGKRRRRGGPATPNHSSSDSPHTPGPSGKRKLIGSEKERTPAKRGRRGAGPRAGQRAGVVNTSGSGTELPGTALPGTALPGTALPGPRPADSHGPLPQNASLFMGFAFMLTASSEVDRQTNQPISEGEEEYVQTSPYNRLYTEEQLQAGGGFVLPDFNQEQCKAAYQSLLIADQHCRTRKYLLCVASGVPCVSHMWVRDCCRDNKLLNYRNYLLPAGVGPDHSIIEWHPSCSPLASLRVLLVFEPPVELWGQLVTLSGAASVRQADKDSPDVPGRFDLVLTDAACPPLVLQSMTSQKVPLVSPEWLIHSIICGQRLDYHSNPQYRHDYCSE